jgi:hypothetical protein
MVIDGMEQSSDAGRTVTYAMMKILNDFEQQPLQH